MTATPPDRQIPFVQNDGTPTDLVVSFCEDIVRCPISVEYNSDILPTNKILFQGSGVSVAEVDGVAEITITGGVAAEIVHWTQQESSATNGGTATSGSPGTIVPLNTPKENTITGASLDTGTGRMTLPNGTYRPNIKQFGYDVARMQALLYRRTAPAGVIVYGTSTFSRPDSGEENPSESFITEKFEITDGPIEFDLLLRVEQTSTSTNGLGISGNFGNVNIYSDVLIEKVG